MKKQIVVLVILALAVTQFWGCDDSSVFSRVKGSGNIVSVDYPFADFKRVEVSNAFEISIIKADSFAVELFVDDNIEKYLQVQHSGEWLIIDLENGHNYNNVSLKAEIRMPGIENFRGSGATVATLSGFTENDLQDDFNLELSGASVFAGFIAVNTCDINISGASVLSISGNCSSLNMESSGASELSMGNFITEAGYYILSGASDGTIHVTGQLDAKLSGASVLRYYGNPQLGNINVSGASTLIKL